MNSKKNSVLAILLLGSTICISVFLVSATRNQILNTVNPDIKDCCLPSPTNTSASDNSDTLRKGCVFKTVFEGEYDDSDFRMATPENAKLAIEKALKWIVKEQLPDGSWYGGYHATQNILKDPNAKGDPATTSMVAMALLRCGSTPYEGTYKPQLEKATNYLITSVESSPENTPNITTITGTQAQTKLGQNIDVMLSSQFFSNIVAHYPNDTVMTKRLKKCIAKCVTKIQMNQNDNGSFKGAGWAGVLQSSIANNALESAKSIGVTVDSVTLEKSRSYQKSNYDMANGNVKTGDGAGIVLYSISSTGRASAKEVQVAKQAVKKAKKEGKVKTETISKENLMDAGMSETEAIKYEAAYQINKSSSAMAQKTDVMAGFGNNGGEEFYSFLQTGEGLIISRDMAWKQWYKNVSGKLIDIQGKEGQWQGHHCITSPVFCTATCLLILSIGNQDLIN